MRRASRGVLVRNDLQAGEANIRVATDARAGKSYTVAVQLLPENFHGAAYSATSVMPVKPGQDTLSLRVPMPGARPVAAGSPLPLSLPRAAARRR